MDQMGRKRGDKSATLRRPHVSRHPGLYQAGQVVAVGGIGKATFVDIDRLVEATHIIGASTACVHHKHGGTQATQAPVYQAKVLSTTAGGTDRRRSMTSTAKRAAR